MIGVVGVTCNDATGDALRGEAVMRALVARGYEAVWVGGPYDGETLAVHGDPRHPLRVAKPTDLVAMFRAVDAAPTATLATTIGTVYPAYDTFLGRWVLPWASVRWPA